VGVLLLSVHTILNLDGDEGFWDVVLVPGGCTEHAGR
jgi:hypothetical protein